MQEDVLENEALRLHLLVIDARRDVRARTVGRDVGWVLLALFIRGLCGDMVLGVLRPVWKTHDHRRSRDVLRAVPAGRATPR